jgi:hypothetical protein
VPGVPVERLQREAPHLVELRRQAEEALAATELEPNHRANVALAIAATSSMKFFYETGLVRAIAEKLLALASIIDDDGAIDLFFLGEQTSHAGKLTLRNHRGSLGKLWPGQPMGAPEVGRGFHHVRRRFNGHRTFGQDRKPELPAYILVVTDSDPFDSKYAAQQVFDSSREPIWWECVGTPRGDRFGFLEVLENPDTLDPDFALGYESEAELLRGRDLDNVHSVVCDLDDPDLYRLILSKYPAWVEGTRGRLWGVSDGLVPRSRVS